MTTPLIMPAPQPANRTTPVPTVSDAELAARMRTGDDLAFELIMRRHNRRLFRLARSLLKNEAEAEDVLQEAYVRAYARVGDLLDDQALAAWLARIVTNEALRRLRAATRIVSLDDYRMRSRSDQEDDVADDPPSDQPDPERLAASGELRRLLEAAVDALPAEFRTVFVLREVEGLSTAETATYLAIRPETVKTRLHRARRLLQEALGQRLLALSPPLFEFDGGRCDRVVAQVFQQLGPRGGSRRSVAVPHPTRALAADVPGRRWLDQFLAYLTRRRQP